uniref:Aldehyde dehydrogenase domain-containing protein n=1 Tax=Alexandrium monilatum TaxID=311494 RepID=A0A7S4SP01_9DINO
MSRRRLSTLLNQCLVSAAPVCSHPILIGGELTFAEAGKVSPVINPATGEAFDYVPDASKADLERAIAAAKQAFVSWSQTPFTERATAVLRFGEELERRSEEFAVNLTKEQGKPLWAAKGEVAGFVRLCKHFAGPESELKPEVVEVSDKRRVEVHYFPRGVVGGITPWNFPLDMACNKILPAVITGNTVIVKPSPYTPLTTVMLSAVAAKAFPAGVVNILSGGDQLGQMIVEHPDVKHVSFTGSAATGKRIVATGAPQLKKVTLELGGNDAAIVLPGTDIKKAAPKIFGGAMFNTGQVCIAIKRVFVHESQYDQMVDALADRAKKSVPQVGDGLKEGTMWGPLNNKAQLERVEGLVEDARKTGGRIAAGGKRMQPTGKGGAYFYEPTIVADVDDDTRIVKEEQFGPALPVLRYKTVDEAVARANNSEYGLGGSVWGDDLEEASKVALRLESGMTWINDHLSLSESAPFGGVKSSGVGRERGGKVGLLEFVESKSLYVPIKK